MAPKRVVAVVSSVVLMVMSAPALASEYRAGELLSLDLSKAVLSPKRIGPPAEFAPVPVQALTDAKQAVDEPREVVEEPEASQERLARTAPTAKPVRTAKPRTSARGRLARRSNPLDAQAMDTRIQTWPCKSGGICNWKR
ncbi:MAG: hypothetical protein AB7I42_05355 [Bradyrhizobium sp.]|uniref:hypothetical protein n=1 Tax=Bradyrhizobium sp. TaxID=376 RepID=UPI00354357A7